MEWQTEKLSGRVCFRKINGEPIYHNDFTIPASEAVGKNAKRNILGAAGVWRSADVRCVRHFVSYPIVLGQLIPSDHLIFQWKDISDIECEITLDAHAPAKFRLECEEDRQLALEEMRENHLDTLCLEFYPSPERVIEEIDQVTELRYLALDSSFAPSIFQTIGRLSHLRGLQLDRRERFFINKRRKNGKQSLELTLDEDDFPEMIFDRAAVVELGKLEHLEVLALRNGITISDDALAELGALKNLKALYLNLSSHEFADKNACVEALSFLKNLNKLEYLNITTRRPHSRERLMRRDLELPPHLKYLVLEGRVYHPNTTRFEKDKREKANGSETPAAILLKYGLPKFDNTRNSLVIGFKSPPLHTATVKPLVKLFVEDGALVCRFKGKEAFRIAGDGAIPEDRQQLVTALREMLLKLPPDDGAKIVKHGIAVDFDAPELAKLIETELAIKVLSNTQNK